MCDYMLQVRQQIFEVKSNKIAFLENLVKPIGGNVNIQDVRWNGDCLVSFEGNMMTDSHHVAQRVAKAIHQIGGRVRIHKIGGGAVVSRRKTGGSRRHSVVTR